MNQEQRTARAQLHTAAQIPGAVGRTYAERQDDFGHTTLAWDPATMSLLCQPLTGTSDRIGLRLRDFTLVWVASDHTVVSEYSLNGHTIAEAYAQLAIELEGRGLSGDLDMAAGYELDPTPQDGGEPFGGAAASGFRSYAEHFARGAAVLDDARAGLKGASTIRCWPHHFDIAVLHPLEAGDAESARSIGFGLSPGDSSYEDAYWYVTPWPHPSAEGLPPLSIGAWHTEGWIGAVLPARLSDEEAADSFIEDAYEVLHTLLAKS